MSIRRRAVLTAPLLGLKTAVSLAARVYRIGVLATSWDPAGHEAALIRELAARGSR